MIGVKKVDGQVYYIDVYEYPNQQGTIPVAELDFTKAKQLCQDAGKRLCTAEEWRLACGNTKFTYGNQYQSNACYSNQENSQGHTSLLHGRTAQIASGSLEECKSPAGIFDMNGNLEEWVLDDWRHMEGNLMGGAWYTYWRYADCTGRYSHEPDYRLSLDRPTDSAGVRCCWSETEPTQIDIQREADRYRNAKAASVAYNPNNEVEIDDGIWMDIYEYPNVKGSFPLTSVSWDDAIKLCKENQKSLCTVSEWEHACKQSPTTDRRKHSVCNVASSSMSPTGDYPDCQTKEGIYDLLGNAWEWTENDLTIAELQHHPDIAVKEIRGGSFVSDGLKAQCQPSIGYPLTSADMKVDTLGFRCCRRTNTPTTNTSSTTFTHQCPTDMKANPHGCMDIFEFPNQLHSPPLHSIDLQSASIACSQIGKHLCTDREWTSGCSGQNHRRWSYGNTFSATRCNHASRLSAGGSRPSGSFADCVTPTGLYDLTGNLWEWSAEGHLRGGNWNFSEGMGQCKSKASPAPHIRNDEIGFRCCATIEEANTLLSTTSTVP